MHRGRLLMLWLLSFVAICSCDDYDDFTASPDAVLTLPCDTLDFDTVITTVGTPAKSFWIFNHGDKGLRIASVRLDKGAASCFRFNIDGEAMTGGEARDFMVRGGDSLYVRAELTMPELGHDSIGVLHDRLVFTLESGVEQHINFVVAGRDGIFLNGFTVEADTALSCAKPYIIYGEMLVAEGAVLTLQPGTTLMFHPDASLRVEGTLLSNGTPDSMVVFRGDRTDRMFVNLFYDNTPMRWGGVTLTPKSHGNVLTCTDLHSGTWGIKADSTDVRLDSCVLHNIGGDGLVLTASRCRAYNTQLSNTLGHCLYLHGGDTEMEYCTLAQFYPWVANRGDALRLSDKDAYGEECPVEKAHFRKCLITGYAEDVIMGDMYDPYGTVDYLFDGSFLKTEASDDAARFTNVTYQDKDDDITERFKVFNTTDFLYDFHIESEEPVDYGIR